MNKDILKVLLKEASDMQVRRSPTGRVLDVKHTPEGEEDTKEWRRKVFTGAGGGLGAGLGFLAGSQLSDNPMVAGASTIGGLTAGGLGGLALAEKTMDKALEKERKKNLRHYR